MKSQFPLVRRAQRVLRMVSDLHRMGFQGLRVMGYSHPMAYRIAVVPAECFMAENGIALRDFGSAAVHSSASDNHYFEWDDATQDTSVELAEKFVKRFSSVAERGRRSDWGYAGWLSDLVGVLATGDWLPVVRTEYTSDEELRRLSALPLRAWSHSGLAGSPRHFPLPPNHD